MVINKDTSCDIENLQLIKEDNEYYLSLSMLVDSRFQTGRFKAIAKLPITPSKFTISENYNRWGNKNTTINLGFGDLQCVGGVIYEIIKEKEQTMTLAEIEKKLGYKIKLVSEKQS